MGDRIIILAFAAILGGASYAFLYATNFENGAGAFGLFIAALLAVVAFHPTNMDSR